MSEGGAGERSAKVSVAFAGAGPEWRREPKKWVRWNAAMRDTFFGHLAGSCNVAASAAAIGLRPSQVHHRRRTNAAFAAAWAETIESAYQLLEMRMIGHVMAGGGDGSIAPDDPHALGPVDWHGALKLLTIHKARREGRGKPCGPAPKASSREESDTIILARLAALHARKARQAALAAPGAALPAGEGA